MSRYIDADATKETLKQLLTETAYNNVTNDIQYAEACEDIASNRIDVWVGLISTADVVEVVRCEDCEYSRQKHILDDHSNYLWCCYFETSVDPFHYCAKGGNRK